MPPAKNGLMDVIESMWFLYRRVRSLAFGEMRRDCRGWVVMTGMERKFFRLAFGTEKVFIQNNYQIVPPRVGAHTFGVLQVSAELLHVRHIVSHLEPA